MIGVELRDYQRRIVDNIKAKGNSLVVLPTGSGKTIIAAAIIEGFIKLLKENEKIIFLSPTRPLCHQHKESLESVLGVAVTESVGKTGAEKREGMWSANNLFVSTPQVVRNDIVAGRLDPKTIKLLIIDEAHHAVGNYAYVFVAKQCTGLIVGLTASPGSEKEKIANICGTLGIRNIEWDREDVKKYEWNTDFVVVQVELPEEFKKIKAEIEDVMREKLRLLKELGFIEHAELKKYNKKEFLELKNELVLRISEDKRAYIGISLVSSLLLLYHAHDMLETHGIASMIDYFASLDNKMKKGATSKALRSVVEDERIKNVVKTAHFLYSEMGIDHPKVEILKKILETRVNEKSKAIVFTSYRSSAERLAKILSSEKLKPVVVVGQSQKDDKGINQKEQIERINKFKEGVYNVLVGTQVLEEGLDISNVDYVIFYEAVPSAIRSIQRAGRTGRFRAGEIILLIAKGTKDETYYWSSKIKQKRMESAIDEVRDEFNDKQAKISNFL